DLSAFAGNSEVLFRLETLSDYGNNLYIDDIHIADAGMGLNTVSNSEAFRIYPNPVSGLLNISIAGNQNEISQLSIIDAAGKIVLEKNISSSKGLNSYTIDLSALPK